MSDQAPDAKILQIQIDLLNERLAHLHTLNEQTAKKKDLFVFFLCLMLLIVSGGFVMMYRIDKIGTTSNFHWTSARQEITENITTDKNRFWRLHP